MTTKESLAMVKEAIGMVDEAYGLVVEALRSGGEREMLRAFEAEGAMVFGLC